IVAPVRLEQRTSERNELAVRLEQDAATHRFDAVDRKGRWPGFDVEASQPCPIGEVLLVVARLGGDGLLAGVIDARVDGVEDAPDEDRSPPDRLAEFASERVNVMERQIHPWTRYIEEEFDHPAATYVKTPARCIASLRCIAQRDFVWYKRSLIERRWAQSKPRGDPTPTCLAERPGVGPDGVVALSQMEPLLVSVPHLSAFVTGAWTWPSGANEARHIRARRHGRHNSKTNPEEMIMKT